MTLQDILKDKKLRIAACENDLALFSLYYFLNFHKYKMPEFHKLWYKDLNDDSVTNMMLIAFRESAKTSLTKIKIVHDICYSKRHFIMWTSKDLKKAEDNLRDIVIWLQTNTRIIEDFGQLFYENPNSEKFTTKKSVSEFITTNKIMVKAYSTSQSPRGEVYGEYRPDLVILDDYENISTIDSKALTQEVIDYIDELYSGKSVDCKVISLSNRLVFGGSVSYLEDKMKRVANSKIYDIPVILNGEITWPDKYVMTDEEAKKVNAGIKDTKTWKVSLESKKRELGESGFSREMLDMPLSEADREFKKEWYQYITWEELKKKRCHRYLAIDTAMSEKESADFTGITECWVDNEGYWYISAHKYKVAPQELVKLIFKKVKETGYDEVGMEKTTFTEGLKPFIQQQMRETKQFFSITELSHGGVKKETRIRGLLPRYENRSIFHIKGETDDLEEQQEQFPRGLHDDVLDSEAYLIQLIGNKSGASADDEYRIARNRRNPFRIE